MELGGIYASKTKYEKDSEREYSRILEISESLVNAEEALWDSLNIASFKRVLSPKELLEVA
jgi:hypothetical protein